MIAPVLADSSFVPDIAIILMAFGLGACVGSFLNVVIWRLPRRCLSLVKPASHCPVCKTPIKWHDNVPVIGWLRLRGKCRACKTAISPRYPLIEALTGALFALVVWLAVLEPGATGQWQAWLLAFTHWVFISLMIAAAFIDADLTVIPEEINWGGTAVILLLALANPIHGGVAGLDAAGAGGASGATSAADLPADIPTATPITSMSVSDFRRDPSKQDLDRLMDSWKHLIVPREGGSEIRFAVSRLGGHVILRAEPGEGIEPGQPIAGMPTHIRISEHEIYQTRYQRSAQAYVLEAVGPTATTSGADRARVANQWPIAGWFSGSSASGFTPHLRSFLGALFGALIAGGVMWLLRATATGFLIKKALLHGQGAAMGMGDVKLLMLFGAMLGWAAALVSIFVGAAIALIVTVPMLLLKKQHLFPFGPFLATAAVVILLFHGRLMSWMVEFYTPVFQAFG